MPKKEIPKYQRMLEEELENRIEALRMHRNATEDYAKDLATIERLVKLLPQDKTTSVSKDVLATIGGNLLGILMIIKHEHLNVITSKALSFVIRPRI